MRKSYENWSSEVETFGFSFVIHLERWEIKLKCGRGEEDRCLLIKAKTTKCRPAGEGESERAGVSVLKMEGVSVVALGDRSDRLHGASVNDPPKWVA
ncbi:hypothetical protein AVEN_161129-1 [Araneus ventricosus]|uniref:Uncharacterized protein n=1 Tax=Araneus ventricosus TaxID=182803 RepID=A0A4Y2K4T8_ARAVE|nr:hypothetical protein AVEN_161129-1 [Araneus ventricosus]